MQITVPSFRTVGPLVSDSGRAKHPPRSPRFGPWGPFRAMPRSPRFGHIYIYTMGGGVQPGCWRARAGACQLETASGAFSTRGGGRLVAGLPYEPHRLDLPRPKADRQANPRPIPFYSIDSLPLGLAHRRRAIENGPPQKIGRRSRSFSDRSGLRADARLSDAVRQFPHASTQAPARLSARVYRAAQ